MLEFVVISDLHLVPRGKLSHGLDTAELLAIAIDHMNAHHSDADFYALAGDLTDDGDIASYERLSRKLAHLAMPFCLTLGNHDQRDNFLKVFGSGLAAPTGCIDDAIDKGGYRVILLDTLHDGTDEAVLTAGQLAWLDTQIEARLGGAQGGPVILVLQHSICELGVPTDLIRLHDRHPLLAALNVHGDVRQVIWGTFICRWRVLRGHSLHHDFRQPLQHLSRAAGGRCRACPVSKARDRAAFYSFGPTGLRSIT